MEQEQNPLLKFLHGTYNSIYNISSETYGTLAENLIDKFIPFYKTFFILMLVLYGIKVLLNPKTETLLSIVGTILLGMSVYHFLLNEPENKYKIYELAVNLPNTLSQFFIKETQIKNADSSAVIIKVAEQLAANIGAMANGLRSFIRNYIAIVISLAAYFLLYILLIVYWLFVYSYVLEVTVAMIIGLPIILGIPFKLTRSIFINWVKYILEIALVPFLVIFSITFMGTILLNISKDIMEKINKEGVLIGIFSLVVICTLMYKLWKNLPKLISIITNNINPEGIRNPFDDLKTASAKIFSGGKKATTSIKNEYQRRKEIREKKKEEDEEEIRKYHQNQSKQPKQLQITYNPINNPQTYNKQQYSKPIPQKNNIQNRNKNNLKTINPI